MSKKKATRIFPSNDDKKDSKKIKSIKKLSKFEMLLKELNIDEMYTKNPPKYKFDKVKENTFPMQDYNFMVDLISMPTTKSKYKYILSVVDLWSDEFDIEPLKTRTAKETLEAFKRIIKRPHLNLPKASIRSDNGGEFLAVFTKYLKDNKIRHRLGKPYRHKQQSNIESLNRQVTRILMTYLTNMEQKTNKPYNEWTDLLPQIRKTLNKYRKKPDGDPFELKHILKTDKIPKYKINDIVIPKLEVPKNSSGKTETTESFRNGDIRFDTNFKLKIIRVLNYPNNNRYILNTLPNVSYAEEELILASDSDDEYHAVKTIIDVKTEKKIKYYKIHWVKMLKKDSTWVSEAQLLEDGLDQYIEDFNDKMKAKKNKIARNKRKS